ncbi:hypothetical protein EDB83DRAFT_2411436 [Lactarius deliciosus]|nr:hypothetical protein EDB83DRAFT_2411436 [Lactarius deliciosus]
MSWMIGFPCTELLRARQIVRVLIGDRLRVEDGCVQLVWTAYLLVHRPRLALSSSFLLRKGRHSLAEPLKAKTQVNYRLEHRKDVRNDAYLVKALYRKACFKWDIAQGERKGKAPSVIAERLCFPNVMMIDSYLESNSRPSTSSLADFLRQNLQHV